MTDQEKAAEWRSYIDGILGASDDDLLINLADQVSLNMGDQDLDARKRLGRAWLDGHFETLKTKICRSGIVSALKSRGEKDIATIVASIADVIVGSLNKPAAATVALLLTRYGLDNLCPGDDA